MTSDNVQTQELIRRCILLRDSGQVEAVLRTEFASRLRLIFPYPEDDSWINHYSSGTEARTIIGQIAGGTANRFIDNLVGSTTIEFESDLRIHTKWNEGYGQVKEHAAGLVRGGTPISQVRGILSDTVDWYAYEALLEPGIQPEHCTAHNVNLRPLDSFSPESADGDTAERLVVFFVSI